MRPADQLAGQLQPAEWVRLHAVNVLDRLDEHARPALNDLQEAMKDKSPYVVCVVEHPLQQLKP